MVTFNKPLNKPFNKPLNKPFNKPDIVTRLVDDLIKSLMEEITPFKNIKKSYTFNKNKLDNDIYKFSSNVEAQAIYKNAVKELYSEWRKFHGSYNADSNATMSLPAKDVTKIIMPATKVSFSLKNGKVGESYSSELQIHADIETNKILIKELCFPEEIGLTFDGLKINGTPTKDGEFIVKVSYQFINDTRPPLTKEFNLFINPDPKALWQKNEPAPNSPYPKKHEDKKLLQGSDNLLMVAASRRGRSHEHSGTFRDDDFLLAFEHGWDILAVADGAGSAKSSRKGAELAVQKSIEFLINSLATQSDKIEKESEIWFNNQFGSDYGLKSVLYETFGRAAYSAVKAIEEESIVQNTNAKDYSTTLLLVGHKKLPIGHFFAGYWVGDGGVGIYDKGKSVRLLGDVDSGEYAGQTRFLDKQVMTPDDVMKRLRFAITDNFTSLVLMTDGVTDPKFETDNNLSNVQKWDELWDELEPILANKDTVSDELLKWLEFWSPGNHDDRTIALLYR
jgi:serine/threonine protein phosphatase PrpC